MKVSESRANLLFVRRRSWEAYAVVCLLLFFVLFFFLPQDIEVMFEAYGIKVSSQPDTSVKF